MSFGRYDQSKARAKAALTSDWSDDNHAFIVKVAQWSKLPTNDFVRTQSGTQALAARNVINDMTEHGFALTPFGFSESWDVWYGREDPISGIFVPFPDDWLLSAAMGAMGRDMLENPKKERMYLWHYHHKGVAYFGLGPNPRIARRMLDQQLDGTGKSSASKGVQQYEIDYNKLSGDGWSSEI